jgi:hypothetical protein
MGAREKRRLLKIGFYRAYVDVLARQAAFCLSFTASARRIALALTGQPEQYQARQDTGNAVKTNLPIVQFEHLLKHAPPCTWRDKWQQTLDH